MFLHKFFTDFCLTYLVYTIDSSRFLGLPQKPRRGGVLREWTKEIWCRLWLTLLEFWSTFVSDVKISIPFFKSLTWLPTILCTSQCNVNIIKIFVFLHLHGCFVIIRWGGRCRRSIVCWWWIGCIAALLLVISTFLWKKDERITVNKIEILKPKPYLNLISLTLELSFYC